MHKTLGVIGIVFVSTALAFSQPPSHAIGKGSNSGDDNHDDGSAQSGWALVTPAVGSTVGPIVFETLEVRSVAGDSSAAQAGLLPSNLTTEAVLFVDSNGRLSKNIGVAIVNPNATSVTVTMTLRTSDGTILTTTAPPITIPSLHQVSKFVTELFENESSVLSDLTGTLDVISTGGPISVTAVRFRGSNFNTIPITNFFPSVDVPTFSLNGDTVGGPGAVLLPQFATGGGWASELVIINPSPSTLTLRVDLFKPDGTALTAKLNGESASSFKNLAIPAAGVLVLAPRNNQSDDDFFN
jgi:hypothetical protein